MSEVFGFDETTEEVSGGSFPYLVVTKETAIQGDIFFKDFVVGEWQDGSPYLEVTVANKQGQTTTGRYSLAKDVLYENDIKKGKTIEDKHKENVTKIQAICKNFATKVLGDNFKLSGTSLKDFFEKTVAAIKSKPGWDKVNLTAVFIHDKAGYTKLRTFSPIVELTSNTQEVAKLALTEKELEKFVDKKTPSEEKDSISGGQILPAGGVDGLPF